MVRAETASDSVMCDRAVLFAYREGEILEDFGKCVPAFEVIGIDSDQQRTFDTVANGVVEYSMQEIEEFNRLVGQIRRAMSEGRKDLLARVATASANINQRHRPKALYPEICRVAALSGALGDCGCAFWHNRRRSSGSGRQKGRLKGRADSQRTPANQRGGSTPLPFWTEA